MGMVIWLDAGTRKRRRGKSFPKIRTICEAADSTLDNVVFINIYVTDIRFREAITRVRNEILNPPYPCASMVQVGSLAHEDWLVEIDAVAALDQRINPVERETLLRCRQLRRPGV